MERRETNITVQGKHYSVVSHTPPTGSHPWHLSGLGIELVAFHFVDNTQPTEPHHSGGTRLFVISVNRQVRSYSGAQGPGTRMYRLT